MDVVDELLGRCQDPLAATRTQHALQVIRRTLALYGPEKLAFSFNGGKDSTVLLHLLRAGIQQHMKGTGMPDGAGQGPVLGLHGIRSFVFVRPDDFQEVQEFIRDADKRYGLDVEFIQDRDFKRGLVEYLGRTGVEAIVLGTRRQDRDSGCLDGALIATLAGVSVQFQDPNSADQAVFCPSSDGWPPFMRVNPIFDWGYHDVWSFLLAAHVPYCSLYDRGYTSLGGTTNTLPNSALQREDGSFAPAHMLSDSRLERAGRSSRTADGDGGQALGQASQSGPNPRTAAILLIGDELLAGKVADTAMPFLCQELRAIGYTVMRVVVLPDQVGPIAQAVKQLSASVDVLLTCGGIGPTLDDVTVEGIAMALGRPLIRHPEFERRMREMFGPSLTSAHLKMAEAPAGAAQLIDHTLDSGEVSRFPLLKCGANIFVLPGVQHLMRQKWRALHDVLVAGRPLEPFHNQVFRLSLWDETQIARALEEVQAAVGPDVTIGSYPVTGQEDGAHLLITLDSRSLSLLHAAAKQMRALLPNASILSEEEDVRMLSRTSTLDVP